MHCEWLLLDLLLFRDNLLLPDEDDLERWDDLLPLAPFAAICLVDTLRRGLTGAWSFDDVSS